MVYTQFLDKVVDDLRTDFDTVLPEKYRNTRIGKRKVKKLQGRSYLGLTFQPEDAAAEASFDLKEMHSAYEKGRPYYELLSELEQELLRIADHMPEPDMDLFRDYSHLKYHLMLQLIPRKGNEEMLESIPHIDVEDLCAVYRIDLHFAGCPDSSILITRAMLEDFNITEEQLKEDALHHAPNSHPASLRPLRSMLAESCADFSDEDFEAPSIYVATVASGFSGAGVLLYPGFLEDAARLLKGDFFILPSSIHELLFISDNGDISTDFLKDMVHSINQAHVAPSERLSDSVYRYDKEQGALTMM